MQISAERDALNREKGQLARQVNLLESLGRELQRQNLEEKARINLVARLISSVSRSVTQARLTAELQAETAARLKTTTVFEVSFRCGSSPCSCSKTVR